MSTQSTFRSLSAAFFVVVSEIYNHMMLSGEVAMVFEFTILPVSKVNTKTYMLPFKIQFC